MSVNATVICHDENDLKPALHKLRKQLLREASRPPAQFFVKESAKKYRHKKRLIHLAKLKDVKDRRYHSKYKQPRPLVVDTGIEYRKYLWRKYADGMTFQVPNKIRRSPWQLQHTS